MAADMAAAGLQGTLPIWNEEPRFSTQSSAQNQSSTLEHYHAGIRLGSIGLFIAP